MQELASHQARTAPEILHWVLHDLRRTAAPGMAPLGVNLPVIERILNHTSGSFGCVAGVYNRYSFAAEMREALSKWSDFIDNLVSEPREHDGVERNREKSS